MLPGGDFPAGLFFSLYFLCLEGRKNSEVETAYLLDLFGVQSD